MATKEPVEEPSAGSAEHTRRRLVEAARDVVAERGWAAASSRALAERAGVNAALINYHFGSKKKLLLTALDEAMRSMAESSTAFERCNSFAALLAGAMAEASELSSRPEVAFLLEVTMVAHRDPEIAEAGARHLAGFRAQLTTLVESLPLPPGCEALSRPALASALAAMMDGLVFHRLIDASVDPEAAGLALGQLIDAGANASGTRS